VNFRNTIFLAALKLIPYFYLRLRYKNYYLQNKKQNLTNALVKYNKN
jgi:hypothetical protein